jgi:hypothetical protein
LRGKRKAEWERNVGHGYDETMMKMASLHAVL